MNTSSASPNSTDSCLTARNSRRTHAQALLGRGVAVFLSTANPLAPLFTHLRRGLCIIRVLFLRMTNKSTFLTSTFLSRGCSELSEMSVTVRVERRFIARVLSAAPARAAGHPTRDAPRLYCTSRSLSATNARAVDAHNTARSCNRRSPCLSAPVAREHLRGSQLQSTRCCLLRILMP